jgi:pyrimidine-nucleoside phosphorylase
MDEPLGNAVGNALEVKEAIDTLKGEGPEDLLELSLVLGAYMLISAGVTDDVDMGIKMLRDTIYDGSAKEKMREFIMAQGGDGNVVDDTDILQKSSIVMDIVAQKSGFIERIDTAEIGMASLLLGGGRENKESEIDLSVGIVLKKKVGDKVEKNDVVATLYANDLEKLKIAKERLENAYEFSKTPTKKQRLVKWIISKNGAKKY